MHVPYLKFVTSKFLGAGEDPDLLVMIASLDIFHLGDVSETQTLLYQVQTLEFS